MKYIYLLFRLFKCPHKFKIHGEYNAMRDDRTRAAVVTVLKCSKCGRMKQFTAH